MNLLDNILLVRAQHRAFRAAYAKLGRLSDRDLRDLGLARGDLARLAYEQAERRVAAPAPNRARRSVPAWHEPAPAVPSR